MNSGFVTYYKTIGDTNTVDGRMLLHEDDNKFVSVYKYEMESWRKLLVNDTNDTLVAFAWSHDNDLHNVTLFPEFWI